jgi:hypothetical protein
VILSKIVYATFSEAMDPLTITTATFTLDQAGTPVSGTVIYVGLTANFTPDSDLDASTVYTATITSEAKDLAGNPLAVDKVWSFTTVAPPLPLGPAPVDLGLAGNFVILTKAGITNVPTSDIVGNIGTSPITGAAITGLDCAEVTGTIYSVDATGPPCKVTDPVMLNTAVLNMQAAYTDAAGRTIDAITGLGAGNISGMDLAPGLYKWPTGVSIDNTGLTLTGGGGVDDVWIFQIAGDLSVASAAIVTLAGGADAKNIFWQVAGQATLGTTSQFKGIILSQTAIVLNSGAAVSGRLLAQTEVTLIQNTVTQP